LFFVVEPIAGHAIEPLIFGRSSGLSPVAVVVAASFWTLLWGPVGLVLATPLTVCLVVVGRHVEHLKFLDVMFGDQPPLTPPQLIYQRMLVGDPIEAADQASEFLKTGTIDQYYDDILLNGLLLAEADRKLGRLDDDRVARVVDTVKELSDDLATATDAQVPAEPSADLREPGSVVCIPAGGRLSEAAATAFGQLLRGRGIAAIAETADALSMSRLFGLDLSGAKLVCLCYLDTPSRAKIDYALRRIARKSGQADVMVALFDSAPASRVEGQGHILTGNFSALADEVVRRAGESAAVLPHQPVAAQTA
jgi:hypothetical protein